MAYGCIGSLKAKPGMRDEVITIMLAGAEGPATGGLPSVRVSAPAADDVTIWTCEVRDTKEQHDSSLQLPGTRKAIAQAMPLIAGDFTRLRPMPTAVSAC